MRRFVVLPVFCILVACAVTRVPEKPLERVKYTLRSVNIIYYVDEGGVRVQKPSEEQFEQSLRTLSVAVLRHHFAKMNIELNTSEFEMARAQSGFLKRRMGNYFWKSEREAVNALDLEFGFKTCVVKTDIFQGWSFSMYPQSSYRMRLISDGSIQMNAASADAPEPSCKKETLEDCVFFRSHEPGDDAEMRRKVNEYYATKILNIDFVKWLSTLSQDDSTPEPSE